MRNMCHPHRRVGRPPHWPTWALRVPTLVPHHLFLLYYMLTPFRLLRSCYPHTSCHSRFGLSCMHPCFMFAPPSSSPPCGQPLWLQILSGSRSDSLPVQTTLHCWTL